MIRMVKCPICGVERKTLYSHMYNLHGLRKSECEKLYPDIKWCDEGFKEKRSRDSKKSLGSPEVRQKLREAQLGRYSKPEEHEKVSKASKKMWQNDEYRKKSSKARVEGAKKQWKNPETRRKRSEHIRKAQISLWKDEEYRNKQCASFRKMWSNPEYRKARLNTFTNTRPYTRSDGSIVEMRSTYEVTCSEYLDDLGIKWEYEKGPYEIYYEDERTVHYYYPDFYLPEYGFFIEVKSDFYYNKCRKDVKTKIQGMMLQGHKVYLAMENELKDLYSFKQFLKSYGCADTLIKPSQNGNS